MFNFKEETKLFALGIGLLILGVWLVIKYATNPINSLALIRHGEVTSGTVLDAYVYWGTSDDIHDNITHSLLYTFRAPDGHEFTKWSGAMWDEIPEEYNQLPAPTEVQYLPSDPSVSRILGEGAQSIFGWVFKDIIVNLLLILVLVSPGGIISGSVVYDWMHIKRSRKSSQK